MAKFNLFLYETDRGGQDDVSEILSDEAAVRLTKQELQELQDKLRKQKSEYERTNRTFVSEERKKALFQ